MEKMNKKFKKKWLKALRSGEYKQARGILRRTATKEKDKPLRHCCLGVLCDIVAPKDWDNTCGFWEHNGNSVQPSDKILRKTGLSEEATDELSHLNDSSRWSFKQIANYISKKL